MVITYSPSWILQKRSPAKCSVSRHHNSYSLSDHHASPSGSHPLVFHLPRFCSTILFDSTAFSLCLIPIHILVSLYIRLHSMDYQHALSLVHIFNYLVPLFLYHPLNKTPTLDKPNCGGPVALPVQLDIAGEKDIPLQIYLTSNP